MEESLSTGIYHGNSLIVLNGHSADKEEKQTLFPYKMNDNL